MAKCGTGRIVLALAAGGLLQLPLAVGAQGPPPDLGRHLEIHERHRAELHRHPGVHTTEVGVSAQDPSRLVIRVYVKPGTSAEARSTLPRQLEGVPVEIVEMGPAGDL